MDALVTGERDPKAEQAFGVQSIPLLPGSPSLCLLLYLPSIPCREIRPSLCCAVVHTWVLPSAG